MKKAPLKPVDAFGARLFVGNTVRRYSRGRDVIHWKRRATLPTCVIEAIAGRDQEHLRGMVKCSGSIAWEAGRNFEKVIQ